MKFRIIPLALLSGGSNVVTSQNFNPWRTIGSISQHLKLQVSRQADEIYIIDINSTVKNELISQRILQLIHKHCDIPVAVGGGIKSVKHAEQYIRQGADKIILTSIFLDDPEYIQEISNSIGFQSVALKLDFKYDQDSSSLRLWDYRSKTYSSMSINEVVRYLEKNSVGELVLTDVDKDGSMKGINFSLIKHFLDLDTPIVLSCGAGSPIDFLDAAKANLISGIAASSIFCYSEHTPCTIKQALKANGYNVRR